jgi:16S rRNA A1518/A1519 N6-dimethyltransferase RsmA/KsgA/DIM1 with predicted DNA glycosylase/AP lyase activity
LPIFESVLIAAVFFVGASIIFSTIKIGISPMPSSKKAYQAIISLLDDTGIGPIYDLGSGWGSLVIRLARKYPDRQIVAYELSLFPWLITKIIKKLLGLSNLVLHREDFLKADLSEASVITCYLFPAAMEEIKRKLIHGKGKLGFIISNNFVLPSYQPSKIVQLNDFYKSPVYLYRMT